MQLIGQENNVSIITRNNFLPSFIIVQGDRYSGKTYMVKYLCSLYGLHCVLVENGVDSVRELIANMKPNSNTVYYFENFDKASLNAKNALLKITEEIVEGNYIIITGSSQLATLESRARKIIMEPYSKDTMISYLSKYYDSDVCSNLYIAGINTPAKCEKYRKYDKLESLMGFSFEIYQILSYITEVDILNILRTFSVKNEEFDTCYMFIDMLISIVEYNINNLLDMKFSYKNVLNLLIECKEELLQNNTLNRKMLLYKTFYQIYLLGGLL